MKKKFPYILFTVSTVLLSLFLALTIDFIVNCVNYPGIETNGDLLGASILILTYAFMFLIISTLGIISAVFSTKYSPNRIIKICSSIEILIFSVGIIFSIFQLLI